MFKINQKVVCINNKPISKFGTNHPKLIKGKIYTIENIKYCSFCGICFVDIGIRSNNKLYCACGCIIDKPNGVWFVFASRFAPLEEKSESHVEDFLNIETIKN